MNNKILGLDVGARRIGVAFGDLETQIATPKKAIFNDEMVFSNLINLIACENFAKIIIGRPLSNSGQETGQTEFTRNFAKDLATEMTINNLDQEIIFQDESLTSVKAEENLKIQGKFSPQNLRNGVLDSEAAVVILTDFLENWHTKNLQKIRENSLRYEKISRKTSDFYDSKKTEQTKNREKSVAKKENRK